MKSFIYSRSTDPYVSISMEPTIIIPFDNLFIPLCKFKHIESGENIWIGNIDFHYISIKERTGMLLFLKDKIRKICDEDDIILVDNWNSDNIWTGIIDDEIEYLDACDSFCTRHDFNISY